jgi:hypothetical protein
LLIPSFLALTAVWYTRFCQAEPAPVVGTTKCPESLCLMLALPSSGRRVPPPPRTLLPVHSSYRLIRQSRVALPYFGWWPRSRSLCRLLPVPAVTGTFPTVGIELVRARFRWRVTAPALSLDSKAGSQFHHSHVSRGPPIIPDGRISQVRFGVLATIFFPEPSQPKHEV